MTSEGTKSISTGVEAPVKARRRRLIDVMRGDTKAVPVVIEIRLNYEEPEEPKPPLPQTEKVADAIKKVAVKQVHPTEESGFPALISKAGNAVERRVTDVLKTAGDLVEARIAETLESTEDIVTERVTALLDSANSKIDELVDQLVNDALDTVIREVLGEKVTKMLEDAKTDDTSITHDLTDSAQQPAASAPDEVTG